MTLEHRKNIAISILIIIVIACSLYIGFQYYRTGKLNERIAQQEDEVTRLSFQNGAYKISLDNDVRDAKIKEFKTEIVVKDLVIEYEKAEIKNLVTYIKFMQKLCEVNDLQYPYYVPIGGEK